MKEELSIILVIFILLASPTSLLITKMYFEHKERIAHLDSGNCEYYIVKVKNKDK